MCSAGALCEVKSLALISNSCEGTVNSVSMFGKTQNREGASLTQGEKEKKSENVH